MLVATRRLTDRILDLDTLEVLERIELPDRTDVGALRLRTVATKDTPCADFPYKGEDGKYLPNVVLDLDLTVLIPRR